MARGLGRRGQLNCLPAANATTRKGEGRGAGGEGGLQLRGHDVRFSPDPLQDSISSISESAHTTYTSSAPHVALRPPCSHGYRMFTHMLCYAMLTHTASHVAGHKAMCTTSGLHHPRQDPACRKRVTRR